MFSPDVNFDLYTISVIAGWTAVTAFIVLIFIRALSTVVTGLFFDSDQIQAQREAARGTVTAGVDLIGEWSTAMVNLASQGVVFAFTVFWYFFAVFVLAAILHIVYIYFPITLGSMTSSWNDNVGSFWFTYIISFVDNIRAAFEKVVGLYNIFVFAFFKLPFSLLLHMFAHGFSDVIDFGEDIAAASAAVVTSLGRWGSALNLDCESTGNGIINNGCYDPSLRQIDFITPLVHVNKAILHVIDFIPRTCTAAAFPTAAVLYPLTDIELSRSLHWALNAVQHFVFSGPALASKRFAATGRVALIVPDWAPCFDYAAFSLTHFGRALDNWLDVVFYMLSTLIDPDLAISCDMKTGSWDFEKDAGLLGSFGANKTVLTSLTPSMFAITDGYSVEYHIHGRRGGIRPRIAAWPIPINVTYGVAAVSYARDLSRDETGSGHTTALMGCMCTDRVSADGVAEGIELRCAIVPYEAVAGVDAAAFLVDMGWEVANTPKRMQCRDTKISVQSIRFQSQRLSTPTDLLYMPTLEAPITCMSRNSCTRIDAAIWVMPVCPLERPGYNDNAIPPGADGACLRGLKDFSCFPYCLGVHRSFAANERIIIRSSDAWEDNVLLTSRDCVFEDASTFQSRTSEEVFAELQDGLATWAPNSPLGGDMQTRKVRASESSGEGSCQLNSNMVSSTPQLLEDLYNSTQMFVNLFSFASGKEYAIDAARDLYRFSPTDAMLLERQPFVFAGDFALRTTTYCRDGSSWDYSAQAAAVCAQVVDVMRITGNEFNEFSIRHILPYGMPVTRRPVTISDTATVIREGYVTLPPVLVRSVYLHNPATSTRDAVWYGVNPDYEMLHCVLRYCSGFKDLVNCLQFSVLSNYEQLRIWKLVPTAGCDRTNEGQIVCPPHAAKSIVIEDQYAMRIRSSDEFDFNEFCDVDSDFNLYIEHMEAFDPLNVIVAIRRGNAAGLYDILWGDGGRSIFQPRSKTVYYFVNVQTMEYRENVPWTDSPAVVDQAGFLCKEMRIMPSLGSWMTESLTAALYLFKMPIMLFLHLPSVYELMYDPRKRCTLEKHSRRHSFYEDCGTNALDLGDFFSALHRANAHGWSFLDFVGTVLGLISDHESIEAVQTFLSGARLYSENQVMLGYTSVTASASNLLKANVGKGSTGGQAQAPLGVPSLYFYTILTVGSPQFMSGMNIGVMPIAAAEYSYRVLTRVIDFVAVTTRLSMINGPDDPATVLQNVYYNMTAIFYESIRTDWDELINARSRRACSGVSLMTGYTTPWGRFLRHWCLAGVEFSNAVMKGIGSLLVEIPLVVCVCVQSSEHNFAEFIAGTCASNTAPSLRPMVVSLIALNSDVFREESFEPQEAMQAICSDTMAAFEDNLMNLFTPWALEHQQAATATIEFFDSIGVLFGGKSADCVDFETNPYVSVMIPSPIDYFRVCGGTSACRTRCRALSDNLRLEIDLRAGNYRKPPMQFGTALESNMFARFGVTDYEEAYLALAALSELHPETDSCFRCHQGASDCVGVIGMPYDNADGPPTSFVVRSYCVPWGFGEYVYASDQWAITDQPGLPISGFLDATQASKVIRVAFSAPYGDHVVMLSELQNYDDGDLFYTTRFQRITVWRQSSVLHTQQVLSTATLKDRCAGVMISTIGIMHSGAIDRETGEPVAYTVVFDHAHILDFFQVVSEEYTIEFVVKVHATFLLFVTGLSERTHQMDVYLRVGWCEQYPPNFTGKTREPASQCEGVVQSGMVCLGIDQEFGELLFEQWLIDGNFIYDPVETRYSWVPSARVSMSSLPHILPAEININASYLFVDIMHPRMALRGSTAGADVLGSRGYVQANEEKMTPKTYHPIRHSAVAHWAADSNSAFNLPHSGVGIWYSASGATVARSWLLDVRYDESLRLIRGVPSRKQAVQVEVERYCNGHSCSGCSTLRLRQICVTLQACIIRNCAGTVVNQGDLLCNLGMQIESLYSMSTSIYIAVWRALVAVMLEILEAQSHINTPYEVHVEWMSDVFYTMTCELKDVIAVLTGLLATLINSAANADQAVDSLSQRGSDLAHYDQQASRVVNTEAFKNNALQAAATHQLLFQLSLFPPYFAFAVHRWLVCSVNKLVSVSSDGKFTLSLGELGNLPPGEEGAAGKWDFCSNEAVVSQIIEATDTLQTTESLTRVLDSMVEDDTESADYAAVANSFLGRGLVPYNLMVQFIDAAAAWAMGVVTGIQDIIYNSELRSCQVPDIAVADSVQCACGDSPANVIPEHRAKTFAEGALWCSGVLHVALNDGSFGYVFNPYSLQELGEKLESMDEYLECLSESSPMNNQHCPEPAAGSTDYETKYVEFINCLLRTKGSRGNCDAMKPRVPIFEQANVSPISVLTRCRANYMQEQWDPGAAFLFQDGFEPLGNTNGFKAAQTAALDWAKSVGSDFLECVQTHAGLSTFSGCLDVYLREYEYTYASVHTVKGVRSRTYFAYSQRHPDDRPSGNPDACLLYTGPATAEAASDTTRLKFKACLSDAAEVDESCELPALAWSGRLHSRTPVSAVHREAVTDPEKRAAIAQKMYQDARNEIITAFNAFDNSSLDALDVLFFSAEGDVLHQMMDCMFLGPYSRLDYVVTDPDETLPPLRWYRDAAGGESRNFDLPCTGEKLNGDTEGSPFTCGSPARRAVIKKYVRGYMFGSGGSTWDASRETGRMVYKLLGDLRTSYTNMDLYGCKGDDGDVSVANCGDPLYGGRGFKPALPPFNEINTSTVASAVFRRLPTFFRDVLTDTNMWAEYYTDNKTTEAWGNWKNNTIALENQLFSPHQPIVSYNGSETMDMSTDDSFKSSIWGLCTSLLSQPMLTIPLVQYAEDGSSNPDAAARPAWMPKGIRGGRIPPYDSFRDTAASPKANAAWMDALLRDAWFHSPMYMHYVTRYVPSMSKICDNSGASPLDDSVNSPPDNSKPKMRATDVYLHLMTQNFSSSQQSLEEHLVHRVDNDRSELPFHSYHARPLGAARRFCPCGSWGYKGAVPGQERVYDTCTFSASVCPLVLQQAASHNLTAHSFLHAVCAEGEGSFHIEYMPQVLSELHDLFPAGLADSCPEFTLSDQWGVFPFDDVSRNRNDQWVPTDVNFASVDVTVDSADFLVHRTLGLSPASLEHVRHETREGRGWSHGTRSTPLADPHGGSVSQKTCTTAYNDTAFESSLIDDFFDELFPVAQLVYEPAGSSACTRYVIERFKLYFVTNIIRSSSSQALRASVARWRTRCEIKAKQNTVCNALGIYNVIPARSVWMRGLSPDCQYSFNTLAWQQYFGNAYYVTPSCTLFVDGDLYNLHRCWDLHARDGREFLPQHLTPECMLRRVGGASTEDSAFAHNPTTLTGDTDPTVLYWGTGKQFANSASAVFSALQWRQEVVGESPFRIDLSKAFVNTLFGGALRLGALNEAGATVFGNARPAECQGGMMECDKSEFCDKVFDWWPEDWQQPHGYHPTATCRAQDNAFRTFDSYMAVDRARMQPQLVYHHTNLRSAERYYQWGGAGGLCRLHSINQPLLETNTHRLCTQSPSSIPNPALPRKRGGFRYNVNYTDEACSAHSSDIPWTIGNAVNGTEHPQMRTVGGVNDILRATAAMPLERGRRLVSQFYPLPSAMLREGHRLAQGSPATTALSLEEASLLIEDKMGAAMPRAGLLPSDSEYDDPWGGCVPQLEPVACDPSTMGSCPRNMQCVKVPEGDGAGVCLSTKNVLAPAATPCYRSDMCDGASHCLAEGVCGEVHMHLWNIGLHPVEFAALVQDTCGDDVPDNFPHTQTFAGASPWETVPDLLQTNGMCAQRHSYAYLYNVKHRLDESHGDYGYMNLRTSPLPRSMPWAWVQQTPSGHMLDEDRDSPEVPRDLRTLHVHPHTCDQSMMHLPGFKVCAGRQGDQAIDMMPYEIEKDAQAVTGATWAAESWRVNPPDATPLAIKRWMRTSDPHDLTKVRVNTIFNKPEFRARGPFAFLGGNQNQTTDTYAGAVGNSQARFMRCINIEMCGLPTYTFTGKAVERVRYDDVSRDYIPFTIHDYNLCGAIGFMRGRTECTLDLDLFPHVRIIAAQSSSFCLDLFGQADGVAGVEVLEMIPSILDDCSPGTICCHGASVGSIVCKYVAIGAATGLATRETHNAMVRKLNNIVTLVTTPQPLYDLRQTSIGLGTVVECLEDIASTNLRRQSGLQGVYGVETYSGVYYALGYVLYEVPILWYYKWIYRFFVWDPQATPMSVYSAAADWDGVIDLREPWDSRADMSQNTIRRCASVTCQCQQQLRTPSLLDSLLCLNTGVRLRVEATLSSSAGHPAPARFYSDALDEYQAAMRRQVLRRVLEHTKEVFGIVPEDPSTYIPGCFTVAKWNKTHVLKDPLWLDHVGELLRGEWTEPAPGMPFDPLKPENTDYFEWEGYERMNSARNILEIVREVVDSYEFFDAEFDAVR